MRVHDRETAPSRHHTEEMHNVCTAVCKYSMKATCFLLGSKNVPKNALTNKPQKKTLNVKKWQIVLKSLKTYKHKFTNHQEKLVNSNTCEGIKSNYSEKYDY